MFQKAFHMTYVLLGVMSLDKKEFCNLRQGNHTIAEYIQAFGKIAHYAPDDVNIDNLAWLRMHEAIYHRKKLGRIQGSYTTTSFHHPREND
jgi:hypothetical protein